MNQISVKQEDGLMPKEDIVILHNMLKQHNVEARQLGPQDLAQLQLIKKDENGLAAGLLGTYFWGVLSIDALYVRDDLRGMGLAKEMVAEAEAHAASRASNIIVVSTINEKVAQFFQRLGFELTGRISNFPTGCSSFDLSKHLPANGSSGVPQQAVVVTKEDVDLIKSAVLNEMIEQTGGPLKMEPLNIVLRDENHHVLAGILAHTLWDGLSINLFYLQPRLRGKGLGSALLRKAENEARKRNCHTSVVYTFDERVKDLFAKNGYQISGTASDFPRPGHTFFCMSKGLTSKSKSGEYQKPLLVQLKLKAAAEAKKAENGF